MIARGLLLAAAFFAAFAGASAAQSVDDAQRGVVRVAVIAETPEGRMLYGTGSGFVVAPNLVVTNAHVVAAARQQPSFGVAIIPPEGDGMIPARIIRYSALTELALLEFSSGPNLPSLTVSTLEPRAGDAILALGYPDVDDLSRPADELVRPTPPSRSSGDIASLRDRAPTGDPIPTINHEAVISSGSSGGPLLDQCGRIIGVNTWHARGADTRESRGVATRTSVLLQFLEEAGVTAEVTEERCLTFAERAEQERAATVAALEEQNRELSTKLETADRLTRISIVILIGGTLSLFVAVCVLGGLLLTRRKHEDHPVEAIHIERKHRSALGIGAVVGGAAVAALLIIAAGIALLRARAIDFDDLRSRLEFIQSGQGDKAAPTQASPE
ncbi:putative protease [alpha proteobacterium U9-1i]|nr:putative protease [alpha proteobacterium U9-1i]